MRMPTSPGIGNFGHQGSVTPSTGARQPSYPDRARIDSDVRYLLRAPSSPWLTFDKGLVAAPHPEAAISPPAEPSNVVLTTDIRDDSPAHVVEREPGPAPTPIDIAAASPRSSRSRQIGTALGGILGFALLVTGVVISREARQAPSSAATGSVAAANTAFGAVSEPAAPSHALPAPPPTSEPAEAIKPVPKGFGHLVVRGSAKHHRVYFDGKLLLGRGQRSFRVFCGDHTIAIGSKDKARDVEVPCNGRLVVSK
jgi:hypothetical protein